MRETESVIEDSRVVADVHHLRLMALLHKLVREKDNRGAAAALDIDPGTVADSCDGTVDEGKRCDGRRGNLRPNMGR